MQINPIKCQPLTIKKPLNPTEQAKIWLYIINPVGDLFVKSA